MAFEVGRGLEEIWSVLKWASESLIAAWGCWGSQEDLSISMW